MKINRAILRKMSIRACTVAMLFALAFSLSPISFVAAQESDIVITLDPGHGAQKSADGSTGIGTSAAEAFGGSNEYVYTLKISEYAKQRLETYADVSVYMTRTSNAECPGLEERASIAASKGSSALISIHNNSASNADARGSEIIVPNKNLYPKIGEDSESCAGIVLDTMVQALGTLKRRVYVKNSTSVKYSDGSEADHFRVLRYGKLKQIPVIMIVECAFLSNREDFDNFFSTEEKLKSMGYAIADGLAAYYGLSPKTDGEKATEPTPTRTPTEAPTEMPTEPIEAPTKAEPTELPTKTELPSDGELTGGCGANLPVTSVAISCMMLCCATAKIKNKIPRCSKPKDKNKK